MPFGYNPLTSLLASIQLKTGHNQVMNSDEERAAFAANFLNFEAPLVTTRREQPYRKLIIWTVCIFAVLCYGSFLTYVSMSSRSKGSAIDAVQLNESLYKIVQHAMNSSKGASMNSVQFNESLHKIVDLAIKKNDNHFYELHHYLSNSDTCELSRIYF